MKCVAYRRGSGGGVEVNAGGPCVWYYSIQSVNSEGWATIVVSSFGLLSVVSDYGNFAYHWPRNGWGDGSFREFLCWLNPGYLVKKLAGGKDKFDGPATLKNIKREILRQRRCRGIESYEAEGEMQTANEFDGGGEVEFANWANESWLCNASDVAVRSPPSDVSDFVGRTWPRVVAMMEASLALEGGES